MNEDTVKLLIAAYDEEQAAAEALKSLKKAKKEHLVDFQDVAVVSRDEKDRLHVRDTGDTGAGQGALAGALTGAVLGALAGPAGLVAGGIVGAFAGAGMAAPDTGIPDEQLAEIGRALAPGTSAVIILSEGEDLSPLRDRLEPGAVEIFDAEVDLSLAEQLTAAEHPPEDAASQPEPGE